MDEGEEPLPQQEEIRRQVQRQARRVKTKIAAAAVGATLVTLLALSALH